MSASNRASSAPLRILIIGTLAGAEGGDRAGGTAILLRALLDELQRRGDVEVHLLDLAGPADRRWPGSAVTRAAAFTLGLARLVRQVDVVTLHTVTTKLWFTGGMALILCRLARRPLLIRKFAGTDYEAFPGWKRVVTKWVLRRCDLYLAETKHLVELARRRDRLSHCRWFPTHRPLEVLRGEERRARCGRFVFVGQVREYKGIRELVEAAERLDRDASVDIFGPLFDDLPGELFDHRRRVAYRGSLPSKAVISTLQQYDALVFPTKAPTEGYPGAILEAFAAGLPVIASACGAISEIVDDSCGILIPPGNVAALVEAMRSLCADPQRYAQLCHGAQLRAQEYSAARWAEVFFEFCQTLAGSNSRANGA